MTVLFFWDHHYEVPETGAAGGEVLKQQRLTSPCPEAGSPRSGCQQEWFLHRPLSSVCRQLSSLWVLMWSCFCACLCPNFFFL